MSRRLGDRGGGTLLAGLVFEQAGEKVRDLLRVGRVVASHLPRKVFERDSAHAVLIRPALPVRARRAAESLDVAEASFPESSQTRGEVPVVVAALARDPVAIEI